MKKIFHTGLYTRNAYILIRATLRLHWFGRSSWLAYGGGFLTNNPPAHTHWGGTIQELNNNFVSIADDGEVVFSIVNHSSQKMPCTMRKLGNELMREVNAQKLYALYGSNKFSDMEDFIEGALLIKDHLNGKKTDPSNPLTAKYIGHPLNPFQQSLLKAKRSMLEAEYERIQSIRDKDALGIPKNFTEDGPDRVQEWISYHISNCFKDMLNVLP